MSVYCCYILLSADRWCVSFLPSLPPLVYNLLAIVLKYDSSFVTVFPVPCAWRDFYEMDNKENCHLRIGLVLVYVQRAVLAMNYKKQTTTMP